MFVPAIVLSTSTLNFSLRIGPQRVFRGEDRSALAYRAEASLALTSSGTAGVWQNTSTTAPSTSRIVSTEIVKQGVFGLMTNRVATCARRRSPRSVSCRQSVLGLRFPLPLTAALHLS